MRIKGKKKLIRYTSGKPSYIRNDISPKNKRSLRVSFNRSRRCNFKPQSHRNKKGVSKRIQNGIETLQKLSDHLSAKSPSSSKFLGKKTSCFGHRGCRQNDSHNGAIRKKERRGKLRRKKRNVEHDEASRLQSRAKYLLIKMKLEQNLIDAYSGDGWKGQSREKIKPEKELQRAEKQILKCKLGIRDAIRQLAVLGSEGSIQDSVIYPDGSVFHEHIFCAKCKAREAFPDNDIILCDGTCNCGFHQKCLEPPLEKIPPEDQGWLCKFCGCKIEILEAINAHLGTCFTVNSNWEDVFKEATSSSDAVFLPPAEKWPSEDSEDQDYFPQSTESSSSKTGIEDTTSDDASTSSSLFCSSDEERSHLNRAEHHSSDGGFENHVKHKGKIDYASSIISIDSVEARDREITSYKRQRRDVDYKKLHHEMFGKQPTEELQTEDEDWGPRRKKQKKTESDAVTTLVDCRDEAGCSNVVANEKSSRNRRRHFRIPSNAVVMLRQVFSENELPSRTVKENLSQQLSISSDKITRWFKNARYAALKTRKEELTVQSHTSNNTTKISTTSIIRNQRSSEVTSIDDLCLLPLSSIIRVPRNWRRILRQKVANHLSTPLSKQHKTAANALPREKAQKHRTLFPEKQVTLISVNRNLSREPGLTYHQVNTCFTDAVHLKRKGRKSSPEKALKTKATSISQKDGMTYNEQLFLVEIERLCCLEDRIQKLKKTLLESQDNGVSVGTHSREGRVIYVPVAEVKEKE